MYFPVIDCYFTDTVKPDTPISENYGCLKMYGSKGVGGRWWTCVNSILLLQGQSFYIIIIIVGCTIFPIIVLSFLFWITVLVCIIILPIVVIIRCNIIRIFVVSIDNIIHLIITSIRFYYSEYHYLVYYQETSGSTAIHLLIPYTESALIVIISFKTFTLK